MARRRSKGRILSNVLIVIGVIMLIVACWIWYSNQKIYQQIDETNERVVEYARLDNGDGKPEVDWDALHAMNGDIVGWLRIPNTIVDYPVFQTGDNQFYLDHGPDREYSIGGAVFLDHETEAPGLVDGNSIIYGHHMRNGSQFKIVADMDHQEAFDGIDTIWYATKDKTYELAPLFVFYSTGEDLDVRQFKFEDGELRKYLEGYLEQAVSARKDAATLVKYPKHVMMLSTCNYYDGYGRTLVVCAPKDEIGLI